MIKCTVITPDGVHYELTTSIINVGSTDGQRGILPNHMPLVLMLDISRMTTVENGVRKHYAIGGGMLYFKNNEATILVDTFETKEQIDEKRALEAKERAEGRLSKKKDPDIDYKRAEVALKKAINRLNVKYYSD